jgi:hypothetical protein
MQWKPTDQLSATQSAKPIRLLGRVSTPLPTITDDLLLSIFGDGSNKRRLRSWGKTSPYSPHFLATRSGTTCHTDPRYPRFSWHLMLHNGGFRIRGLADSDIPELEVGSVYVLDTHSPHEVIRDPRMPQVSDYKVQVALDADAPIPTDEAIAQLVAFVELPDLIERMLSAT